MLYTSNSAKGTILIDTFLSSVGSIATRYGIQGSGYRIPVRARFFTTVQNSPGAHPAFCTMGTGSTSLGYSGRGVALSKHPYLDPRLKKE